MRILQIHNKYQQHGGEDTAVMLECSLLKQNGHQVEQLFFDNKNISSSFSDKLKTGLNSIHSISSLKSVEERIKLFKPDILHVHNFFPLLSPSVFYAATRSRLPVILTIHNYRLICASAILYRNGHICEDCVSKIIPLSGIIHKCYRDSYLQSTAVTLMSSFHKILGTWSRKVDKYIVLTQFSRKKFIESSVKLPVSKVVVKPNFVDDLGVGDNLRDTYFVFLGRLTEEKGIKVLIEAIKKYNFRLKIIGDGPLKDWVEKQAIVSPEIEYVGFKNKEYIIEQLKKARALILPSIWYEGLPLTVIESLSTGTPIIISDLPSFKEILTDNYNGFHFKVGDSQDLADKIKYMNTNIDNLSYLYLNARKTYLETYTSEKNYKILVNIYQNVIEEYAKKRGN